MSTKRLTTDAILTAAALVLFVVEAQIPPIVAIPGIKPGLANIVTLVAICVIDKKDAGLILLLRITLGSVFSGTPVSFLFSAAGGVCCYIVMCLLSTALDKNRIWAVSVFGALAHNAAQLTVAVFVLGKSVLWYSPTLILSSLITGVFTGICAQLAIKQLSKIYRGIKK